MVLFLVQRSDRNQSLAPRSWMLLFRQITLFRTGSKEPSSTCILRQSTCNTITNTPGFYTPLPPLNLTCIAFTKRTTSMGGGLFAQRNFKAKQMIFSERPLLVFPRGFPFRGLQGLSKEEAKKKAWSLFEIELKQAFKAMTKEDADAFLSLSNCVAGSPRLYGIAMTNASRIKLSCMPNIRVDFDFPTFSFRVIAQRDVNPGEQIFYCYCQHDQPVKERQSQLATYGFVCQCRACVNAPPETDKLREEKDDRLQKILDQEKEMFGDPGFSLRSLDPLLKLEKDVVKEGLDSGELVYGLLGARNFNKLTPGSTRVEGNK